MHLFVGSRNLLYRRVWFVSAVLLFAAFAVQVSPAQSFTHRRLLGYYPEWGKYNTPAYTADQIPYGKLTHISHAFLLLTHRADGSFAIPQGMIEPALISKAHAAGVKVMVSIGGGDGIQGPRIRPTRSRPAA